MLIKMYCAALQFLLNFFCHYSGLFSLAPHPAVGLWSHDGTHIRYHTKEEGTASPYDGNPTSWSQRLSRHPLLDGRKTNSRNSKAGNAGGVGCTSRTTIVLRSTMVFPGVNVEERNSAIQSPCTVIATTNGTIRVSLVPLTSARSLRSRVTGNCHARWLSPSGVVTPSFGLTSKSTSHLPEPGPNWRSSLSRCIIPSDCIPLWGMCPGLSLSQPMLHYQESDRPIVLCKIKVGHLG
jgi:hypothetical protein